MRPVASALPAKTSHTFLKVRTLTILIFELAAIIHWQKQIKNVLKQDPETSLKEGKHPEPMTEIDFWKNKSENLNSICLQLNSERIKKVLKFLEQNKSTYTTPFSKLQKEVQIA